MSDQKEVYFHEYCPKCEHKDILGYEDPCNECLANPSNTNSHKPVMFKEVDKNDQG